MSRKTPWIRPDNTINDLALPASAVDMNGQEVENLVIHKVADTDERNALIAVKGKMAYQEDTDGVYICTSAS